MIKSTPEILAFKILDRKINNAWINWAVEMLMAGYTSENLLYLAGENEKTNQFELKEMAAKALAELGINYSDKEKIIKEYVAYLVDKAIANKTYTSVLITLKDLYVELGYESYLSDFYSLYCAQEDLKYDVSQWYWDNATRENITQVIEDYFQKRKLEFN